MKIRIPKNAPINDISQKDIKKMSDAIVELRKNPIKGWKKYFSITFKPFFKRDPMDATYMAFKTFFDMTELPFTRKDAETVRTNMLRLSNKLYEIHLEQTEEVDAEIERRQKNE